MGGGWRKIGPWWAPEPGGTSDPHGVASCLDRDESRVHMAWLQLWGQRGPCLGVWVRRYLQARVWPSYGHWKPLLPSPAGTAVATPGSSPGHVLTCLWNHLNPAWASLPLFLAPLAWPPTHCLLLLGMLSVAAWPLGPGSHSIRSHWPQPCCLEPSQGRPQSIPGWGQESPHRGTKSGLVGVWNRCRVPGAPTAP